jgi:hypothetical protein
VLLGDRVGAAVDCAVLAQALNTRTTPIRLTQTHKLRCPTIQSFV